MFAVPYSAEPSVADGRHVLVSIPNDPCVSVQVCPIKTFLDRWLGATRRCHSTKNNNVFWMGVSLLELNLHSWDILDSPMAESVNKPLKAGFYRVELFKTVWEIPDRYQDLSPVGTGAYGTVW